MFSFISQKKCKTSKNIFRKASNICKPLQSISWAVEYDLVFGPEDAGKEGYLITWYISPTGEEGPPSNPLKFTII